MKRVKRRRRRLRIGNPLGFTLFCILCLVVIGGLYLGVSWCVKNGPELISAFKTVIAESDPTPTAEPVPTPALPTATPTEVPSIVDTPAVGTPNFSTATPTPFVSDSPEPTTDPGLTLYGYTIGIDPCRDKGSKYSAECEFNLSFSQSLAEYLEQKGAVVVLTRESNTVSVSNDKRASIVSGADCDIALRIMCNEIDSSSSGCYVKCLSKYESFAKALIAEYASASGLSIQTGKKDGVETGKDSMASGADCPCVLLIMGNWANKTERAKLQDEQVQRSIIEAIYRVLVSQLGAN
jgi:N-acetylmuramoyl-L-alanine amidase